MVGKAFSFLGVPALVVAVSLLSAPSAPARPWVPGYTWYYPSAYSWGYSYPWYSSGYYYPAYYSYYYPWTYSYPMVAYETPAYSVTPTYYSSGPAPSSYASFYAPEMTDKAVIKVKVPPDAQLLFDGTKMKQTGSSRVFDTPPLTPGQMYGYEITARWKGEKGEVSRTQHITLHAGDLINVDLTKSE